MTALLTLAAVLVDDQSQTVINTNFDALEQTQRDLITGSVKEKDSFPVWARRLEIEGWEPYFVGSQWLSIATGFGSTWRYYKKR